MEEVKKYKIKKGKKTREVHEIHGTRYTKRGIELTRASQTMTEAEFFAWILSGVRKLTQRWKPAFDKLNEGKRPYTGKDKRTKWEYECEGCKKYFKRKEIELDHIENLGGINGFDKIEGWFRRAFVEKEGYRRLCTGCHSKRTLHDRKKR